MGEARNRKHLFKEAYDLANKINKGRAYAAPIPPKTNELWEGDMLIDGRTILISGIMMDVIDSSFTKEYTDFDIICMGKFLAAKRRFHTNPKKLASHQAFRTNGSGLFGHGWVFEYETFCHYKTDSLIVVYTNNQQESFVKRDDFWINENPHSLTCVSKEDRSKSEITIWNADYFYTYSFDGRLKRIADKNKNFLELRYIGDSCLIEIITSSCGKTLDFRYRDNKIVQITDNINRSTKYFYEDDALIRMEQADGGTWEYCYDKKFKRINKVIDSNSVIDTAIEYDRKGNPVILYLQSENSWKLDFDEREKSMTFQVMRYPFDLACSAAQGKIENPLEPIFQFSVKYDRTELVKEMIWGNEKTFRFDYDDRANLLLKEDSTKGKNFYSYNEHNQLISNINADNSRELWQYNDSGILTKNVRSNGYEKIFEYDRVGNLTETRTKINVGLTAVIQYVYDAKGRLICQTDANKNAVKYIYRSENSVFPETTEYPNGFRLEKEFDEVSRIIQENILGTITKYTYNNIDMPVQITYQNGRCEFRRYDHMGHIIEAISPKEVKKSNDMKKTSLKHRYFYDEKYVLTYMVSPMNKNTRMPAPSTYDKFGYAKQKEPDHLCAYDFIGNVLKRKTPVSCSNHETNEKDGVAAEEQCYKITLYTYDKNNNLLQEKYSQESVDIDKEPSSYTTVVYQYDNRNNASHIHISTGEDHRFFYTGINRLSKETVQINETTVQKIAYEYNDSGLLSERVFLMAFEDADLMELEIDINEISAIPIKTKFTYDGNNQLIAIILPDGSLLNIEYNDDGEIAFTSENDFLQEDISGKNLYCQDKVANEEDVSCLYDKHGRLIKKTYADAAYEIYDYDFANNISVFTDADGKTTKYKYNSINRLKELAYPNGIKSIFLYGLDGEVKSEKQI